MPRNHVSRRVSVPLLLLAFLAVPAVWHLSTSVGPIAGAAQAQRSDTLDCPGASRIMLRLGIGDQEQTDWSGSATGWVSSDTEWAAESESSPVKQGRGGRSSRILPARLTLELPKEPCESEAGEDREITVKTSQGEFSFEPMGLALGTMSLHLDGRVEVYRIPAGTKVVDGPSEQDYPHCAGLADGSVLCAYVEYDDGQPVDEAAALNGDFGSIEFQDNGDRVAVVRRFATGWGEPTYATKPRADVWRPSVMALPDGGAAVLWAEQRDGNWDLFGREYTVETNALDEEIRITSDPGSDINVVASGGYFAWQGRRGSKFDIFASRWKGSPMQVSTSEANDWRPSIATGSNGTAWIAWDTYDAGNYDVFLRRLNGEGLGEPIPVAVSPRFEARASVAVDAQDRAWVAFEDSDAEWGKDSGDRWPGRQASSLYVTKNILVRVWDGALRRTVRPPTAPSTDSMHDDPWIGTHQKQRISIPTMALDDSGRPWVLFRRHPLQTGRGERWRSYAAFYGGSEWSDPIPVRPSEHLLDRQPGLVAVSGEGLLAITAHDGRKTNVRDRENSDLYEAVLDAGGTGEQPRLVGVDAREPIQDTTPVHSNEKAEIEAIRTQTVEVGGKTLRFFRGEFHRHTEFSAHRDWDGPFEEVWRYGLDVADMDWIGPGDHDYATSQGYLWWIQQKAADMYHQPGQFSAMYTYERSATYPSGHRNVMHPRRGIRPLPRMQNARRRNGTPEDGSPDIQNLFAYLKHFDAICSSHTSATNMGTDWRDSDPVVEPVVEIFQGHRQSYELAGGPRAATGEDDTIQGYRPLGFVWEAFKKGIRLGFQASSDHVSTHISYAIVLAEENSREGIIDGFRRRHSYAAHDNIAMVVRSGDHLMGDEFTTGETPKLQIQVNGTATIDQVDIIRQVGLDGPEVVASLEPGSRMIDLEWSDPAAAAGKLNMYYVRLEQSNSAMAWASPLWIHYKP